MTPQQHYAEAERLLAAGVEVVGKIANTPDEWHSYGTGGQMNKDEWVTKRRDELGKKAMGIWAQAQVHATLAAMPPHMISVEVANAGISDDWR